jgi:LPPG:FO 2-phospho-L-lactate transferase
MTRPRITVLSGGLGGARLACALATEGLDDCCTFVTNVGDDVEAGGLLVCPDTDAVLYALLGCFDDDRGWGVRDDTFPAPPDGPPGTWPAAEDMSWFHVGARDRSYQRARAELLAQGLPLGEAVRRVAARLGVRATLAPVCDAPVRTFVVTDRGTLSWQEWLVRDDACPRPRAVEYRGAAAAHADAVVLDAIREADLLLIAPSSPIGSIAPILAVPGVTAALLCHGRRAVAISPHVARRPPVQARDVRRAKARAALLGVARLAHEPAAIATWYREFVATFVLDPVDAADAIAVDETGVDALVAPAPLTTAAGLRQLVRELVGTKSGATSGAPASG